MSVAVLATNGVEQVELDRPWQALEEAGAEPALVSLEGGTITAYDHIDKGDQKKVDAVVSTADPDAYAALVLPGGVINGDFVRADADAVAFVTSFFEAGKPVAAICHAPWVLIEAGVVKGRRFIHGRLGVAFEAPEGFTLENTSQAVLGSSADGGRVMQRRKR